MDCIVPGGVACDLAAPAAIGDECTALEREVRLLKDIYDDHSGLQDRFLDLRPAARRRRASWA